MWVVKATPRPFYLRERPYTHFIGGWMGPRSSLDGCDKSRTHRELIPGLSSTSESVYRLSYPGGLFKACCNWCNWNDILYYMLKLFKLPYNMRKWGTRWRSWLRHFVINPKGAGLIPDGVIFWHTSGRTLALGSIQLPTEMSTREISGSGKGGRCVGLKTIPISCDLEGPIQACNGIAFLCAKWSKITLPTFCN